MKKIRLFYQYIKYLVSSVNGHSVNSPFVSELVNSVIYVKQDFYAYKEIEKLREKLLDSSDTITYADYGAGGSEGTSTKKISVLAKDVAKSPKYGQLLFRLVNYFQPAQSLELGTSIGISTAYMASAGSAIKVCTIEGSRELSLLATKHFKQLKLGNIEQVCGSFDDVLKDVIQDKFDTLDFVFFDGNHRKEATLNYFELCLQKANENSVFVFDDIHWSEEMTEAWQIIKKHEKVNITIDLFFMGLVFFRKEEPKKHFLIRF